MVTRTTEREIDWSTFPEDDGEPMAETNPNAIQMIDLIWTLQTLFERQGRGARTAVGGNQLMYYNQHDGREHVSPDVYAVLDRRPPVPSNWKTWVEGKFPDIVSEITSPSTQREDLSLAPKGKRALYTRLGVREYYVYDPQGEMDPVFQGFELRAGRLEPLPLLASGGIQSPLLVAELRPMVLGGSERGPPGTWLRVIDPATGRPVPLAEEEHNNLQSAERARRAADRARQEAEVARQEAERAREVEAARAMGAEAELEALRAEVARLRGTTGERP